MSDSTANMVLRPGDVDFDPRKLRDLEITEVLGVGVTGGAYNQSSKASCDTIRDCNPHLP